MDRPVLRHRETRRHDGLAEDLTAEGPHRQTRLGATLEQAVVELGQREESVEGAFGTGAASRGEPESDGFRSHVANGG